MPMKQRVVDHIVEHLAAVGVDYIFGVDGANIEDLYDAAFFQSDITAVLAKHEFSAAAMADGYSRSGGDFGVVAATSGGGALNLVAGLGNRLPAACRYWRWWVSRRRRWMVAAASGHQRSQRFAECRGVFLRSRCLPARAHPADIASASPAAVAAARTGGPAVLLLPKDVQHLTCGSTVSRLSTVSTGHDVSATRVRSCGCCAG